VKFKAVFLAASDESNDVAKYEIASRSTPVVITDRLWSMAVEEEMTFILADLTSPLTAKAPITTALPSFKIFCFVSV
jgi:hypothetical protein